MSELTPTKPAPGSAGGSPSIVSRRVGAGIQARLAQLQGATGAPAAPVVTRDIPKKFASGFDEPFRERLDGTLRRSLSGTWSVHTLENDNSSASTDGSQTLIDVQTSPSLPTVSEDAELKRRRDFTKSWEKQQEAVADQLFTPEPTRIQSSPQPIIEEPEPEEEAPTNEPAPTTPIQAPVQDSPKHGILTPPISEPESTPVRKTEPKPVARPQTTGPPPRARARPAPAPSPTPTSAPKTPSRPRPHSFAPSSFAMLAPPVPRLHLTPSPSKSTTRASLAPPRAQTSLSIRRASAPARPVKLLSSKIPDKVLPPPVRPRTISKVYEGPTLASLAKQRPPVSSGLASRAVSRAGFS
ncbi:hypothetical protein FRC08_008631 [Ceratobasidium sp. 394]|nr:hypothetical protein FRC08_008631 [Ceratobasidium sp. 394]